jgi:hypothetical protein
MLTVMYVPISCDSCKLKPQARGKEESRVGGKECAGETNCVRGTRPLDDDHVSVSNQKCQKLSRLPATSGANQAGTSFLRKSVALTDVTAFGHFGWNLLRFECYGLVRSALVPSPS